MHNHFFKTTIPINCINYYLKLQNIIFNSHDDKRTKLICSFMLENNFTKWYRHDAELQRKNKNFTQEDFINHQLDPFDSKSYTYKVFWKSPVDYMTYLNLNKHNGISNRFHTFNENSPNEFTLPIHIEDDYSLYKDIYNNSYLPYNEHFILEKLINEHLEYDLSEFKYEKVQVDVIMINLMKTGNKRKYEPCPGNLSTSNQNEIDNDKMFISDIKKTKTQKLCNLQEIPCRSNFEPQKNVSNIDKIHTSGNQFQIDVTDQFRDISDKNVVICQNDVEKEQINNLEIFDLFKKLFNLIQFGTKISIIENSEFITDENKDIAFLFIFYICDLDLRKMILKKTIANSQTLTNSEILELYEFFRKYFLLIIDPNTKK
ncbi:hypothetical protein GVAV_000382 [Gurleya vavrai]